MQPRTVYRGKVGKTIHSAQTAPVLFWRMALFAIVALLWATYFVVSRMTGTYMPGHWFIGGFYVAGITLRLIYPLLWRQHAAKGRPDQ